MRRPLGGACTGADGHLHRLYERTAPSRSRNIYRHGCGPHGGRLSLDFLPRLEPLVLGLWRRQRRQQPNGTTGTVLLEDYIGTAAQVLKPFASNTVPVVPLG